MRNYLIDKPYKFIPRFRAKWPQQFLVRSGLLERILRKREGVVDHEIRHLDRLAETVASGDGILLISNHCRTADPSVLQFVSRALRCPFYFMASWHVFNQGLLQRLILRCVGGFSVNREGLDRRSIDEAIDIVQTAERPLVMFPEGTTSRTNDRLMDFMEGLTFIARAAARRRAKSGGGKVVCHPVALKYIYLGDIELEAKAVLADIENRLTWRCQTDLTVIERLRKVGDALLTLKELEFGLQEARPNSLSMRQAKLVNHLLRPLEREWLGGTHDQYGTVVRVKNLTMRIFPGLSNPEIAAAERQRRWKQMEDIDLAQQIDSFPDRYVEEFPSAVRILETLEKFEEYLLDQSRVHGQLKVIVEIGEPIEVSTNREKDDRGNSLTAQIKQCIGQMLERLQQESQMLCEPKPDLTEPGEH